jgi:putative SOS response-associated peptidase YedK
VCGRYTGTIDPAELAMIIALDACNFDFHPRHNIAPTQTAPIIAQKDDRTVLQGMRWGLIPSWAENEKIGHSLINARIETASEKPAFREAWKHRRCLVPADGFFEWESRNGRKQPWHFHMKDRTQFCFAGVWETWIKPPDKQGDLFETKSTNNIAMDTFTILTTHPNALMAELHDRMPVMLRPEHAIDWLRGGEVSGLAEPFPAADMARVPVSEKVNSPKYDTPECLAPIA